MDAIGLNLQGLVCTYPDSGASPTLDAIQDVECWTSEHAGIMMLVMLFLPPYMFFALRVVSKKPSGYEVWKRGCKMWGGGV